MMLLAILFFLSFSVRLSSSVPIRPVVESSFPTTSAFQSYVSCIFECIAFVPPSPLLKLIVHPIDFILVYVPRSNWERIFVGKEKNRRSVRIGSSLSRWNDWIGLVKPWQHPSYQSAITSSQIWESAEARGNQYESCRVCVNHLKPAQKRKIWENILNLLWHPLT